ncbi:hypothetical protein GCM10022234_06630 [Aeromicrobium panaciterrae]|uniref:HNH endonuclease signature motif containing protein n=1 Tax=Aeromicrobium panaciterrae TaxID=363861 RepID=UPI0031CE1361
MATAFAPTVESLTDFAQARARAEACEVEAMLAFQDAEIARTATVEPAMRRQVERAAIPMSIGEATGFSEGQIHHLLSAASTVRDQAPRTWQAFRDGRVDRARVRDIAHTIDQLQRNESVERLDARVIDYAVDHTTAELRVWLRRFVQRVEEDLAVERAKAERAQRHVSIKHADDAMGWLNAYLPSHELAAIEGRLHTDARKPVDTDDDRTVSQREADLLVAWCADGDSATKPADVHVAVTIDADVLAGAVDGFAQSTDGRWGAPASWITEVTSTGNVFWHRMVLEPVSGDVLSHEYLGRFCPDILAVALRFRDGVCQAPGCMVPAERCDIDHRVPYPEGPTSAANLGPFCRRNHNFKSHGVLRWSTRPPPQPPPPIVIEIYRDSIAMELA